MSVLGSPLPTMDRVHQPAVFDDDMPQRRVAKTVDRREKLSYPIIQLPLEIMRHRDLKGLFGNQALTIGFALAVGIDLLNGLSVFIQCYRKFLSADITLEDF